MTKDVKRMGKMMIIGDNQVGLVFQGLNERFVNRHDVMLVPVKHIVQIIASYVVVSSNSTGKLKMIFGLYEYFQIKLLLQVREVLNE